MAAMAALAPSVVRIVGDSSSVEVATLVWSCILNFVFCDYLCFFHTIWLFCIISAFAAFNSLYFHVIFVSLFNFAFSFKHF
jgi:hypothetical protein